MDYEAFVQKASFNHSSINGLRDYQRCAGISDTKCDTGSVTFRIMCGPNRTVAANSPPLSKIGRFSASGTNLFPELMGAADLIQAGVLDALGKEEECLITLRRARQEYNAS
jgi:hypothetical protein